MSRALLFILTVLHGLIFLDRYLVAAALPVIAHDFMLSDAGGGRLVAAYVFGYFLFSPLFGFLGDRGNRPRLMAIGTFLWSAAVISGAAFNSLLYFAAARVFVGIGEASFGTIAPGYIKDAIADPVRVNRALGIFFTSIPVGSALGYVVAGYFTSHWGWHSSFLFAGGLGLCIAPLLLCYPEPRRRSAAGIEFIAGLRHLLRIRALRFAIVGYILNSFALTGMAAFVSSFGVQLGFGIEQINVGFGIVLVATGCFGTIVGGIFSEKIASRSDGSFDPLFRFMGLSALGSVPLFAASFLVHDYWTFLALSAGAQLLVFLGVAATNTVLVLACPEELVTLAQSVTVFALNLFGSLLGPLAVGMVSDATSLTTGLQVCTLAMAGAGVIWFMGTGVPHSADE